MAIETIIEDEAITDTLLNQRTVGWGNSFPSEWYAEAFFIRKDLGELYQNTGTQSTPSWTKIIGGSDSALIFVLG